MLIERQSARSKQRHSTGAEHDVPISIFNKNHEERGLEPVTADMSVTSGMAHYERRNSSKVRFTADPFSMLFIRLVDLLDLNAALANNEKAPSEVCVYGWRQ